MTIILLIMIIHFHKVDVGRNLKFSFPFCTVGVVPRSHFSHGCITKFSWEKEKLYFVENNSLQQQQQQVIQLLVKSSKMTFFWWLFRLQFVSVNKKMSKLLGRQSASDTKQIYVYLFIANCLKDHFGAKNTHTRLLQTT